MKDYLDIWKKCEARAKRKYNRKYSRICKNNIRKGNRIVMRMIRHGEVSRICSTHFKDMPNDFIHEFTRALEVKYSSLGLLVLWRRSGWVHDVVFKFINI